MLKHMQNTYYIQCLVCPGSFKSSHASLNNRDAFWKMCHRAISSLCEPHGVYLYKSRWCSLLHTWAMWYLLLLLGYKPVQHVIVPNTSGSYKIVVCVCVSKQKKYSKNMVLQTYGTTVQTLCSLLLTKMLNGTMLYSVMWPYHIFFMHSSVHGHMGYFYFWAITNSGSMNMYVQGFGWT